MITITTFPSLAMATSTSKSAVACTASRKLVSSLSTNSSKNWHLPDTNPCPSSRTKCTTFALCVDDLGMKYFSLPDATHLINAVKAHYDLTIDWIGKLYCGLARP
jgi:hypothetical protein